MSKELVTAPAPKLPQSRKTNETELAPAKETTVDRFHNLQRALGNRRVADLIRTKRLSTEGRIINLQPKLTVGAADDPHEREADRVAQHVLSIPDSALHSAESNHRASEDQEANKVARAIQLDASHPGHGSFEAGEEFESRLNASSGRGSALPDHVRSYMEPRFGADFGHVRVHTGNEAAELNRAVGAKAFAHGSEIYYGSGYAPGHLELTAHELTHVVQQTGGATSMTRDDQLGKPNLGTQSLAALLRQQDGGATTPAPAPTQHPGTATPVAVPAPGASTSAAQPAGGSGQDKAWATDLRAKVQAVQDAAQAAGETLNDDADVALKSIKDAQRSYDSFEGAYNEAVGRFTKGVKKAMESAEELRKNVKVVAAIALAAFGGEASELVSITSEALEKVAKAGEIVGALQTAGTAPGGEAKGGEAKGGEEKKPDVHIGPTDQTDWRQLLQTTVDSYDKYIKGNKSISAITKASLENVRWLDTVIEGKGSDNARTSSEGQASQKLGDGSTDAITLLRSIKSGAVSSGAADFAKNVSDALDKQTSEKIEQDIAIKWISSLSKDELSAIKDAGSYLKKIGVIDSKGNRLGVDTGIWTTDWDATIIRVRAQTEQRAKQMVGTTRRWGGGKLVGGQLLGEVHGDEKTSDWWHAVGPPTLKEEQGGEVRVVSYSIAPIDKEVSSNWERANESQMGSLMISKVTLSVQPAGETHKVAEGGVKQ